jgi:N-acetylmuramic acid 6-phosphate (MurNAc-6-P) etherase
LAAKGDNENFAIRMLANSLVDESGKVLFNAENIVELKAKNAKVLGRLINICSRINLFDEAAAEKNSLPA